MSGFSTILLTLFYSEKSTTPYLSKSSFGTELTPTIDKPVSLYLLTKSRDASDAYSTPDSLIPM